MSYFECYKINNPFRFTIIVMYSDDNYFLFDVSPADELLCRFYKSLEVVSVS